MLDTTPNKIELKGKKALSLWLYSFAINSSLEFYRKKKNVAEIVYHKCKSRHRFAFIDFVYIHLLEIKTVLLLIKINFLR